MPCRQVSTYNGTSGSGKSGGGGYATEAECLQACKEGACCEGTTCTVKPQCQCVCQSGSCCGPDTVVMSGQTYPACRQESKADCTARGGTWFCGRSCNAVSGVSGNVNTGGGVGACVSTTGIRPEPVFKGVGTTCSPNPCFVCYECLPPHPTYVTVSFSQTAPITGGFHESLVDLSGAYSVPSASTSSSACLFCGSFSKTYANALPSNYIVRNLTISFRVTVAFSSQTRAVAIAIYGTSLDANEIGSRAPGLYRFAVTTGGIGSSFFSGCAYGGSAQMQPFTSCSGNSYAAVQQGWTNAPTSQYPYRIEYNQTTVNCGTLSWSQ